MSTSASNDDDNDLVLQASLRYGGVCAAIGPVFPPYNRGFMCNLDIGHQGAHIASIAGVVQDTWV